MSDIGYSRYVAIGDSQTEGLWDGDDGVGLVGFADRLAALIDSHYPGLKYANLAVRGRRVGDVLTDQLPRALSLQPDLVTVCVGMNDVTRPGRSFNRTLPDLEGIYARLAQSGATVVTTTFPDVADILPVGGLFAPRILRINRVIRTACDRHGFRLVDLYSAASMKEPDTWSADRMHGSTKGHVLFASAAAEALGLPFSNHDWAHASLGAGQPSFGSRAYAQLRWTQCFLLPWIWRHLVGRSSGDGCLPKRALLESLTTRHETGTEGAIR